MPNYDYTCKECEVQWESFHMVDERHDENCECGLQAFLMVGAVRDHIVFREGFYEHLDVGPIHVSSKQQLKDECNKRELFSPYAWD